MDFRKISLIQFKNYEQLDLEFSPKINCFVGNNGAGKTNLLDAIYYLSLLATQSCEATLCEVAQNGSENLKLHATEALEELSSGQLKH